MKQKKWRWIGIILALVLLFSGCSKNGVKSEPKHKGSQYDKDLDIAIVMDASGSMLESDPNRIAIEAAEMFIDMLSLQEDRATIFEFANQVSNSGLINIQNVESKDKIKQFLNSITYQLNNYTDTGLALKEAVNALISQSDYQYNSAVLLFTDGQTELQGSRSVEDSLKDVDDAVELAIENKIKIYCIGLNSDGTVNHEQLANIAERTGGSVQITSNIDDLPEFFNNIFEDLGSIDKINVGSFVASGDYDSVDVHIDNGEVIEANLVFLSEEPIEEIKIYDPSGNEVAIDGNKVVSSISSHYTVLKIINPDQGTWNLKVKGIKGDNIQINLLYSYDFTLNTEISQRKASKGDVITVTAKLSNRGSAISDTSFYDKIVASAIFTSSYSGEDAVEMTYKNGNYTVQYELKDSADYTVQVHLEGRGLYRDSKIYGIEMDTVGLEKKSLKELKLESGKEKHYLLNEYFNDPNNNELSYRAELILGSSNFEYKIEGDTLILNGLEPGKGRLRMYVTNSLGNTFRKEINIEVINASEKWIKILLILGIAMLAGALAYWFYQSRRSFRGQMLFSVTARVKKQFVNECLENQFNTENDDNDYVLIRCPDYPFELAGFPKEISLMKLIKGKYLPMLLMDANNEKVINEFLAKQDYSKPLEKVKLCSTTHAYVMQLKIPEVKGWKIANGNNTAIRKKILNIEENKQINTSVTISKVTETDEQWISISMFFRR